MKHYFVIKNNLVIYLGTNYESQFAKSMLSRWVDKWEINENGYMAPQQTYYPRINKNGIQPKITLWSHGTNEKFYTGWAEEIHQIQNSDPQPNTNELKNAIEKTIQEKQKKSKIEKIEKINYAFKY